MSTGQYSVSDLEDHERDLVLETFTNDDAWLIGARLTERARLEKLPVVIDVRRADELLFRSVMNGATADQSAWIERKSATAFRFQASSLLVGLRMAADDRDPFADGWLEPARYTLAGGAFPIRVTGAGMVGAVTVSGLSSDDDHTLIVQALRDHRARPEAGR